MLKFYLLLIFSCLIFLSGIAVGYYEVFPFDLIQSIKYSLQNNSEKEQNNISIYEDNIDSLIKINSKNDILDKRKNLINFIWKNTIPYSSSISIDKNIKDDRYQNLSNLKSINKLNIDSMYDPRSDPIIIKINDIYTDFLRSRDIDKFITELYKIKSDLSSKNNIKSNIKKIIRLNNKQKNNIIVNPLYESPIINRSSINISDTFINNQELNYIQIDILSQGKFINLSYPTLGIIKSTLSTLSPDPSQTFTTLLELFNNMLHYIHYKFEGDRKTINEINSKIKIDRSIIRHLTIKYKKLDTNKEFFKKDN